MLSFDGNRVIFCYSTAMNVAAADVLQLNLNAESKETRAAGSAQRLAVRRSVAPPSDAGAEAELEDAMIGAETSRFN